MIYSFLLIFSFISLALGDVLAKILLHGISEILLPTFYSRTFMVSEHIFKSFIHFEFILVYSVSWSSSFFLSFLFLFFAWIIPDLPAPYVEETVFIPFYTSVPFVKY